MLHMTLRKSTRLAFIGFIVTALVAAMFMFDRGKRNDNEDYPVALTSSPTLPLRGVTLDTPYDISKAISVIKTHDSRLTIRLVMDAEVPIKDYKKAVNQLSPHANIMIEIVDSQELSEHSAAWVKKRTEQAFKAMGNKVSIWEIGNELNGEWVGDSPKEINSKAKAAYDVIKKRGGRTAVTLNYWSSPDCYAHDWESTLSYGRTLRKDFSRIDYIFLSVYETACTPRQHPSAQDLSKTLTSLGRMFPNAYLGIGEIGAQRSEDDVEEPSFSEKERLATYYYGLHGKMKQHVGSRYAGGYFWWYFRQDAVDAAGPQSLWPSIQRQMKKM